MPNGIDLIVADHQHVNELFAQFDANPSGTTLGLIVAALTAHDEAEQAALYPLLGTLTGGLALVQRAQAAHSMIKKQIDNLKQLEGPPLTAAARVLRQIVARHVEDEERKLLPTLAAAATPQQLEALGVRFLQAKQRGG